MTKLPENLPVSPALRDPAMRRYIQRAMESGSDEGRDAIYWSLSPPNERMGIGLLGDFVSDNPQHYVAATEAAKRAIRRVESREATSLEAETLTAALKGRATELLRRIQAYQEAFIVPLSKRDGDLDDIAAAVFEHYTCNGEGHYLDIELARVAEKIGASGKALATRLQENARDRLRHVAEARAQGASSLAEATALIQKHHSLLKNWDPFANPMEISPSYVPPLHALVLLGAALWEDGVKARCEELKKVPYPSLAAPITKAVMFSTVPGSKRRAQRRSIAFDAPPQWSQSIPTAALTFANKIGDFMAEKDRRQEIVPLVAAALARKAWEKWRLGGPDTHIVTVPAGRDGIRKTLGVDGLSQQDLEAALDWLRGLELNGHSCVAGWNEEETKRGGRPGKVLAVSVGAPLAPMALQRALNKAGAELPPALRWYGPVFDPTGAPRVGDNRTRGRQRAFFAIALGAYLIERRAEYLERGGIQIVPQDWRRSAQAAGLYHRTHASLADDMLNALCTKTAQGDLWLPRTPFFVETDEPGRYRLGDGFKEAERMVLDAAQTSARGRARQAQQKRGRGRKRLKSKEL